MNLTNDQVMILVMAWDNCLAFALNAVVSCLPHLMNVDFEVSNNEKYLAMLGLTDYLIVKTTRDSKDLHDFGKMKNKLTIN